jgi:hypothetical protein
MQINRFGAGRIPRSPIEWPALNVINSIAIVLVD